MHMSEGRQDDYRESRGITLSSGQCEAIRRLVAVAQAGAQTISGWPTTDCAPGEPGWVTSLDMANAELRLGMQHVSKAIAAIATGEPQS